MKASDREETEPPTILLGDPGSCGPGRHAIDPKALHDDLLRGRGRVFAKNMTAVEIGDGDAECTCAQLGGEQIRAPQQVGAVKGETVANAEQLSSGQSHPRCEVSV